MGVHTIGYRVYHASCVTDNLTLNGDATDLVTLFDLGEVDLFPLLFVDLRHR
jgi:hypothetical protein